MEDRFSTLRTAVRAYLDQPEMSIDAELAEFRNAASVFTIDALLKAHDTAVAELARLTRDGPLEALTADEVRLIQLWRSIGPEGQQMVTAAADATFGVFANRPPATSAEVVQIRRPQKTLEDNDD